MDIDHRIGFAERDEATRRLSEHHAAGRLEVEEFEERVEAALRARTIGDLIDIFHDLPDEDWMVQEPGQEPTPTRGAALASPSEGTMVTRQIATGNPLPRWLAGVPLLAAIALTLVFGFSETWWIVASAVLLAPLIGLGKPSEAHTITFVEGDITSEVKALLGADLKIRAIKRWREAYPWVGLAEAKAAVEMIERGQEPPQPRQLGR